MEKMKEKKPQGSKIKDFLESLFLANLGYIEV
jgi:hypothetical protein